MGEDKRKVVIEKYRTFLKVLHKDLDGIKDYSINPMCSEYKINKSVPQVLQRRGIVGKNIFGKYEWTSKYKPNRKMIEGILKDISTLNNKQKKEKQKNMTNEQEVIINKKEAFLGEITERVGGEVTNTPTISTEEILDFHQPKSSITEDDEIRLVSRLVQLTPQLAETLLGRNLNNRPLSRPNLTYLIKEITSGNWIFDANPIRIDKDGHVLDGQHRLTACVECGVTIKTLIITGVDAKSFTVIDSGKKRTGSDALSIAGVKNGPLVATTIKHINLFNRGCYGEGAASRTLSPQNMLDFYHTDSKRLSEDVSIGKRLTKGSSRLVSPSVACSLLYLFSKKDRTMALNFITKMCSGTNIEDGSPINALRNRLINSNRDKSQSLTPSTIVKLIIHAWNKYRAGEKSKILKIPMEKTITIN